MLTKSIRLTEEEAAELRKYVEATGDVEAAVLKRAAMRGLQELRIEQALLAYLKGSGSAEAAGIAGLPRAQFLQLLLDKGVTVLEGPSTLPTELEALAGRLGDRRLETVARQLRTVPDE